MVYTVYQENMHFRITHHELAFRCSAAQWECLNSHPSATPRKRWDGERECGKVMGHTGKKPVHRNVIAVDVAVQ
ncbi:hypothetical protein FKM82_025352 [Ascaphus truei]